MDKVELMDSIQSIIESQAGLDEKRYRMLRLFDQATDKRLALEALTDTAVIYRMISENKN